MENISNNKKFIKKLSLKSIIMSIFACLLLCVSFSVGDAKTMPLNVETLRNETTIETSGDAYLSGTELKQSEYESKDSSETEEVINEPSAYADKEEKEENPYKEDTMHMVYFAVYFVEYVPESKKEEFFIQTMYLAPQASSPAMTYDAEKAANASTVCKLTYAEKEFYIYDSGAIAHNREYKMKDHYREELIDMPKAEIVSSKAEYKYIGYKYHMQSSFSKYKSTKLLPGAKNLNGIDGTSTKATQKSNGYENLYNITISFYFYKPSQFVLLSKNPEYGRFSNAPETTFDNAKEKISVTLPEGIEIRTTLFPINTPKIAAQIKGTIKYVTDSVEYSREIDETYYVILNEYCHIKNRIPYQYLHNKGYHISYTFTQEVFDLSLTINTNISHSTNASLFLHYGTVSQHYYLENGTDNNIKITFEDLPAKTKDSLLISLSTGRSDYKYIISETPVTSVKKTDYYHNIIEVAREIEMTKDTEIEGISCYIYELYEFNIETRTEKETSLVNRNYKINGVDYTLQKELSQTIDGFKFMGYSLAEDSLEIVDSIDTDDNITLYANWKKTINATLYYHENYITLPDFNYGTHEFSKTLYNFDTDNTLTIDSLPEINSSEFIGYTKDLESYDNLANFEIGDTVYDGELYYAVFRYNYSFAYDLSLLDSDTIIIGEVPEKVTGVMHHIVYGKKESMPDQIITDNLTIEKAHYDFLGWSEYAGSSNDPSSYYQAGDKIAMTSSEMVIYPKLDRHPYYITVNLNGGRYEHKSNSYVYTYNEQANTVTFTAYNDERFDLPYSVIPYYSSILRDGYEVKKVTALVNPEKLTSNNTYSNISADETFTLEWERVRYNVNFNLLTAIPNDEPRFDTSVTYSYYDIISNETITGNITLNLSNSTFSLKVPMDTVISLNASIEADNFNLAFGERSCIENKTCTYSYTSKGDGNSQNITLFLTRVYKIRLIQKGVTEGNEEEIIYKYYDVEALRLPTNIGKKDGYIQTHWNTNEDGTGTTLTTIQKRDNKEYTFYAIWSKYVKFYLNNSTECSTKYLSTNDVYSGYEYRYNRITIGDITYNLAGFSTSPNSTTIEYDGTSNLTFSNSVSWYAVYKTSALTHTITENVDVKFHLNDSMVEKTVSRSIIYSDYTTYYNVDFTIENNNNFSGATLTYKNDTLEFIDDTVGDYMVYGWNNSGNYTDDFFTKDDEIIVKTKFDFYPIYRTINYDESQLPHTFYYTTNTPITRYSTIYTLSNSFKVLNYDFSAETRISDTKTYEPIYGNLEFDRLDKYNPNAHTSRYSLYGWGISEYALFPKWQSGEIEVSESTTWYVVWKLTDEETINETLTHTFYINENRFVTKNTTKIVKLRNKITIMSCNRQFKDVIDNGEIISTAYTYLDYLDLSIENYEFSGWSTDPNSTNIEFDNINRDYYKPTENITLYPVYTKYYDLIVTYSCEGRDSFMDNISIPVYVNHNNTAISLVGKDTPYLEYQIKDFDWTQTDAKFLGWSFADNDDLEEDESNEEDDSDNNDGNNDNDQNNNNESNKKSYFAGDIILIENIQEQTYFTLFAIIKQPEIIKVTITINDEEIEKNCLEGDKFELITPEEIEGKEFKHWSVNNKTYLSGETITLTSNTEIVAVYKGENDDLDNNGGNNGNQNNDSEKGSKTGLVIIIVIASIVAIAGAVVAVVILKKKKSTNPSKSKK